MEVIRGWTHAVFPIDDASRIGEARRHGASLGAEFGWSEVDAGRLAIVITELATNLQRHAVGGRLLIAHRAAFDDIEVVCVDGGPGMSDVSRSMQDGVSTGGGSPGTGLGAVRRLTASFELHSSLQDGTVCVARVARSARAGKPASADPALLAAPAPSPYAFGAICLPIHGEAVCGDAWALALEDDRATLMVADGLGHGAQAAEASQAALDVLAEDPTADLRTLVERSHIHLRGTRGAALCVLRIDAAAQTVGCAGAGNVAVRVVSGVFDRSMVTQHGTAGVQIRKPEQANLAMPLHGVTIVHSDGLQTRWDKSVLLPVLERDPTLAAALLFRNFSRGRDDATVVVVRAEAMA